MSFEVVLGSTVATRTPSSSISDAYQKMTLLHDADVDRRRNVLLITKTWVVVREIFSLSELTDSVLHHPADEGQRHACIPLSA